MKDFNYIDKIVKDSLNNVSMPVNTTWNNIDKLFSQTKQVHIVPKKGILSTLTSKIILGVTVTAGIITSVIFLSNNNKSETSNNLMLKPTVSEINVTNIRNSETLMVVDNFADNIENNQQLNLVDSVNVVNNNIVENDTNSTTVILIETTETDTIKNR